MHLGTWCTVTHYWYQWTMCNRNRTSCAQVHELLWHHWRIGNNLEGTLSVFSTTYIYIYILHIYIYYIYIYIYIYVCIMYVCIYIIYIYILFSLLSLSLCVSICSIAFGVEKVLWVHFSWYQYIYFYFSKRLSHVL